MEDFNEKSGKEHWMQSQRLPEQVVEADALVEGNGARRRKRCLKY